MPDQTIKCQIKTIMKKPALYKATLIAFLLIPVLVVVRLFCPALRLDYGNGDITVNSIFLLLFAIYAFFVSIFNFIKSYDYWRTDNKKWGKQLIFTYIFVFIFALSLPFLMTLKSYNYAFYSEVFIKAFAYLSPAFLFPEVFIEALVYVSPAFLFPIGVVLFFLSLVGLQFLKGRAKSYLIIIFFTSVLFVLGGAASAYLVFGWWIQGGMNWA